MAVIRMVPALLPLAWLNSSLLSYGCTQYGASIIAFGLRYLIFAIVWLYRRVARVLLPLAGVDSSLFSYGHTPYGATIITFGLGYFIFAIVRLYVVWRVYYCLWPGLSHLCYRMAVRHMARVLLPLAWVTSCLPLHGGTSYGASIIAFGLG